MFLLILVFVLGFACGMVCLAYLLIEKLKTHDVTYNDGVKFIELVKVEERDEHV